MALCVDYLTFFLQKCDCAKLRMLKFEHLLKFVNLVVTGIVGFQCVQHLFFKPDATVDMYAGEQYEFCLFDWHNLMRISDCIMQIMVSLEL